MFGIGITVTALPLSVAGLLLIVGEPDDGPSAVPQSSLIVGPPDRAVNDAGTGAAPRVDPHPFFRSVEEALDEELPPLDYDTPDRQLVKVSHRAANWRVGDRIDITVPPLGKPYRSLIERIHAGGAARRSFLGQLEPDVPYSRFILTIGPSCVYASLSSGEGNHWPTCSSPKGIFGGYTEIEPLGSGRHAVPDGPAICVGEFNCRFSLLEFYLMGAVEFVPVRVDSAGG